MLLASFDYRLRSDSNQNFCLNFRGFSPQQALGIRSVRRAWLHRRGWSGSGWLSKCGTAWVSRTSSNFRQVVMFALDLDQRQFAITGKISQHHDGCFSIGMSSRNTGRMETLWRPQGSPYSAYLARTPRTVLSGISKIRPMAAAFTPATEVPLHTIVELQSYLSRLSLGTTASQTQRTVGIYGPLLRNYWLDYH